jgi:glycosyltransferase involved in cell wall biosynthesis
VNWLESFRKRGLSPDAAPGDAVHHAAGAAQVIVYVHSSAGTVRDCLSAALESFSSRDLLIVQDTRDTAVDEYLTRFAADHACVLIQNLDVLGFQRSVVKAMNVARAEYLVVVDSDVVVTAGGLRDLAEELAADSAAEMAVGLLDIQLRQRFGSAGEPDGRPGSFLAEVNAELVAAAIEVHEIPGAKSISLDSFSGLPCFAIRRSALSKLAPWETPWWDAGEAGAPRFHLRFVPGCYASHRGVEVPAIFRPALDRLDSDLVPPLSDALENAVLGATRIQEVLKKQVLFLLPSPGGTGGAHSVVQEVAGLRRCGLDARIVNRASHRLAFEQCYPESSDFCLFHADEDELVELAHRAAIVVATNYASVASLKMIVDRNRAVVPLYYVQDYEPWFYPEQDPRHAAAKASYHLVPNQTAFAKTKWLCDTIHRLAGIDVAKIEPSMDRTLYNGLTAKPNGVRLETISSPVTITAMIRPSSARRNPLGTLNVLRQIQRTHGKAVDIRVFGCKDEDLDPLEEAAAFRFVNLGELKRWEVADVLRGADIFLDFSSYQAFGCTGLEAMAVGCATVLPRGSGAEEYAIDDQDCLLVDPADDREAVAAVERLITDGELMQRIRREALRTGRQYSVEKAVWSLLRLFGDSLGPQSESLIGGSITVAG